MITRTKASIVCSTRNAHADPKRAGKVKNPTTQISQDTITNFLISQTNQHIADPSNIAKRDIQKNMILIYLPNKLLYERSVFTPIRT